MINIDHLNTNKKCFTEQKGHLCMITYTTDSYTSCIEYKKNEFGCKDCPYNRFYVAGKQTPRDRDELDKFLNIK